MSRISIVRLIFVLISACASLFANAEEGWLCSYSTMEDGSKIMNQHYDVNEDKLFGPKIELTEGRMVFRILENDEVNLIAVYLNRRVAASDATGTILRTVLINKKSGNFKLSSYGVERNSGEIWNGTCVKK